MRTPSFIRDQWRRAILALLDRHGAVYVIAKGHTSAQYQQLFRLVVGMEAAGEINTWSYLCRWNYPGHKVLLKPGHTIDDRNIPLLKDSERLSESARPEQEVRL
jgi:hypothetical protein